MIGNDIEYLNLRDKHKSGKVRTLVNVYDKVRYVPFEKYATQAKRVPKNIDDKIICNEKFSVLTHKNFGKLDNENLYLESVSKFCVIMKIKLGYQDSETELYLNESSLLITKDDIENFNIENVSKYNIEIAKYRESRLYLFENSYIVNFEELILKKKPQNPLW